MAADRNALPPRVGGGASHVRGATAEELAAELGARLVGDGSVPIRGVRHDSRDVQAGDLFVALSGARSDGARFVAGAVEQGAAAVLIARDRSVAVAVPVLYVDQPRLAMARAAAMVYGRPTRALSVVGITGTNGKTTTAHLLQHMLDAAGARTAVLGTLGGRFEDLELPPGLTSPEVDDLMRFAAEARARGASHMVMEVSSIALESERVAEVDFDVAVFTNLTQDHLDFHGDMAAYARAKERLFFEHRAPHAVINVDDPFGEQLAARLATTATEVLTVSAQAPTAAVHASRLDVDPGGMRITAHTPAGPVDIQAPLVGRHNALNVLTALAVVAALGLDVGPAAEALAAAPQVSGRLELCSAAGRDDIVAVVDYAHTPDALARVLQSLREVCSGRLHCVFGCGGDRDPAKRGPMGAAVAKHADVAIVTNDNPRSEDPAHIADAVVAGLRAESPAMDLRVELDRAHAIDAAVAGAAPGDVVVVAGKGHETYQIFADRVIDFDDRVELRRALAARRRHVGGTD